MEIFEQATDNTTDGRASVKMDTGSYVGIGFMSSGLMGDVDCSSNELGHIIRMGIVPSTCNCLGFDAFIKLRS